MTQKRQEKELEVAEMLKFLLGVMRMDKIGNEYIRGAPQIEWFGKMLCNEEGWIAEDERGDICTVCSKEGYAESGYAKKDRNRLRWRLMICFYEP